MALVTVVVPAHNAENTLAEAIESLLRQTYAHLEILVVDDGSTDNTARVTHGFRGRVRYVYQKNAGPSAARNAGIAHARGEYVTFLDADDVALPQRVAVLVEALEEASPAAVFAATDGWMWDGKRYIHRVNLSYPTPGERTLADYLDNNRTLVGILARREVLQQAGGFPTHLHRSEDYHLWLRLLANGHTYAYVPEPLYLYRLHPGTLSRDEDKLRRDACLAHREALHTLPLTWSERRRVAYLLWRDRGNLHITAAKDAFSQGSPWKCAWEVGAAAACHSMRTLLRPHYSLKRLCVQDTLRGTSLQVLDDLSENA